MHRIIHTPEWGAIKTREQYTGWIMLSFAITLAFGNAQTTLFRIADHGASRGAWAALFLMGGFALLFAPILWRDRQVHLVITATGAGFWAFFGVMGFGADAYGAAMIAAIATGYMAWTAMSLYDGGRG